MILSTGMGTLEEIREAVAAVRKTGNSQLALLKCSSAYPADPGEMHLAAIQDMKRRFQVPIGLSDHTMGHMSALVAVALGAKIIEKHFCLSREIENPDASFSMTPEEYAAMAKEIRAAEEAIGQPVYGISPGEESSVVFRRSIFTVKDIKKGEALTEENTRVIRPGYGLKPRYYRDVIGMRAGRDLERGTPLAFDGLEKGAILFATNNPNTDDLYQWLAEREPKVYKIENKLTAQMVEQLAPSFVISFNYRHLIPQEVLSLLPGRVINLHTSLLPYNRGSSPNFFSFLEDTPKGVTIHLVDKGLDTGDILCQREISFDEEKETFASSYDRLLQEIKALFRENWEKIKTGALEPVPQRGEGTSHKMKELDAIRARMPFAWEEQIARFKERFQEKSREGNL